VLIEEGERGREKETFPSSPPSSKEGREEGARGSRDLAVGEGVPSMGVRFSSSLLFSSSLIFRQSRRTEEEGIRSQKRMSIRRASASASASASVSGLNWAFDLPPSISCRLQPKLIYIYIYIYAQRAGINHSCN
jgi:hypothetical protein